MRRNQNLKAGSLNSEGPISPNRGANQGSKHASSDGQPPEAPREWETIPALSEPWPPRQGLRYGEKSATISSSLANDSSQAWLSDALRPPTPPSVSQFSGPSSHWDDSLLGSFLTQLDSPQPSALSEQFAANDVMPEFISWMFPPVDVATYPEQSFAPREKTLDDGQPISSIRIHKRDGAQKRSVCAASGYHAESAGAVDGYLQSHSISSAASGKSPDPGVMSFRDEFQHNRLALDEMHPTSTGFDAEAHLGFPWAE